MSFFNVFFFFSRQPRTVQHAVGGFWLFCPSTLGTSSLSSPWPASRTGWWKSSTYSHTCRASPTTKASLQQTRFWTFPKLSFNFCLRYQLTTVKTQQDPSLSCAWKSHNQNCNILELWINKEAKLRDSHSIILSLASRRKKEIWVFFKKILQLLQRTSMTGVLTKKWTEEWLTSGWMLLQNIF